MKINKYFSIKKNLIYLMIFLSIFICKVDVFANPKDNSDKIPIFCVDTMYLQILRITQIKFQFSV